MTRSALLFWFLLASSCEDTTARATPPALAASTRQAAMEDAPLIRLLHAAPLVIHARVERVVGRDGTMGRLAVPAIFSDVTLSVLAQVGKPSPDSTLTLTVLGGEVGDRAQQLSGQVRLTEGEELIAFVDPAATPHPFIGGTQGVFRVVSGHVVSFDGRDVVQVSKQGFTLAQRPAEQGRVPVAQGTATGFADRTDGAPLTVSAVLQSLERLRAP